MKSELVEHSPVRKELKIEIPAETVAATYKRVSNDYARYANLPGFRQGRAPLSLVQRRFKSELASDTLRQVIPKAVESALAEHNLQPLGEPDVHLENADGLKDLGAATVTLHAHVEVMPEVEVKEYKGLEGVRRVRPIDDESVEKLIEHWREQGLTQEAVEGRGAQDGDTATVALKAIFTDDSDGFEMEELKIEVGGENTLPEFNEALQGAQVDDERKCSLKYAADFETADLAGKEVEYTLLVNGLHYNLKPEANDEWAQSLDQGYESMADLRTKVRARMDDDAAKEAQDRLRAEVFNKLVDAHDFEVPKALVEMQTDRLLQDTVQRLAQSGFDPRSMKSDFWRSYRESMKPQGERDVRGMLLVERIADLEGFEAAPEDIEAYIVETAEAVNRPLEEVRAILTKDDGESSIAASWRNRKVMDLLVEKAVITDGEWTEPGPPPMAEEEVEDDAPEVLEAAAETEEATAETESSASVA